MRLEETADPGMRCLRWQVDLGAGAHVSWGGRGEGFITRIAENCCIAAT